MRTTFFSRARARSKVVVASLSSSFGPYRPQNFAPAVARARYRFFSGTVRHSLAVVKSPVQLEPVKVTTGPQSSRSDLAVIALTQEKTAALKAEGSFTSEVFDDFSGKAKSSLAVYATPKQQEQYGSSRLLLVGTGPQKRCDVGAIRSAVHVGLTQAKAKKANTVTIFLPEVSAEQKASEVYREAARTAVLSNHHFNRYLKPKNVPHHIQSVHLVGSSVDDSNAAAAAEEGACVASGTLLARELVNARADDVNPTSFAAAAAAVAAASQGRVTVDVVQGKELLDKNYHLIYAVGQAAVSPPAMVTLRYNGNPGSEDTVALVGKGVTFDTGGLNLKPTGFIENMHMDMGGAAAVLAATATAANMRMPINIVSVLGLAENAIGAEAVKPHSVIPSAKGSVEVSNTDAEGRLVLADCLTHVQALSPAPAAVVDMATLTGACVVALGEYAAGVFSNCRHMSSALAEAGEAVAEPCWPMPVFPGHEEEIVRGEAGGYADMKSTGNGREGGACTAAAFLKQFIDEGVEWAHVDIAGPGMYSRSREWVPKGGTGYGVALLIEYLKRRSSTSQQ
mmetsp:Transcript_6972/g.13170  ORF Transcript_6972/g.13170 Transcript_6972/m.13170 type:complete len:566 (-) Transcript_6972:56-1753(-)